MMRIFILVITGLISTCLWSQNPCYLRFSDTSSRYFSQDKIKKFSSKNELTNYLSQERYLLIKKGYVLASLDKIRWQSDTAIAYLFKGEKFAAIQLTHAPENAYIIRKTPKLNERLIRHFPFKPRMIETSLKAILHYLNNHGYPFAKVYLTPEKISAHLSLAKLNIEKGPLVHFTEINIKGKSKIKAKYIQNAIGIKKGDVFNAKLLKQLSTKVKQIKFVKEIRPYEILFTPEGARLYLYLESVPVSSVNGIVGLQPDATTGKTTVTGEVQLQLSNVLKQGEELALHWQSLKPKTQDLTVHFQFPFLFSTPFGVQADFQLHKEDTTYLNLQFNAGILYFLSGGSYVKVFYTSNQSNLLTTNTGLAQFSTFSENRYGIGYFRSQVDYIPNPSKGFNITFNFAAGRRESKLGKDSTATSTTYSGNLKVEWYIPITPRNVIRLANTTESYYAPHIYTNELYQFGGLGTQRGFDEQSLYASSLSTFTIEYRYLVDKNSHAFAFFDQSIYEKNAAEYVRDTPFGFGLGYAFGTKIGTFSISYALGKQFDNPIRFKEGKIHFGYIAYF